MLTKFYLIFLLSIFLPDRACTAKPKANYDLIIEKFEVTEQDAEYTNFGGEVKEIDGKNAINVNFTVLKDVPPTDVQLSLFAFYNNKYNSIPISIKKNICELLENEFKLIEDQLKDNAKIPTKCPIQKGEYYIKDFAPNIDNLPIPASIPWNRIKITTKFIREGGKVTASFDAYVRLEKKKSKKSG